MTAAATMPYRVATFRSAGLQARWTRTRQGAPIIAVRHPQAATEHQRTRWYYVDQCMWADMAADGIIPAYDGHTLLADIFSI